MAEALYQPFPIPGSARGHVWHHVPATRRPRHFHAEPELNLIAAGHAVFGVGEAIISVSTGDLLWWPPGQDHVLVDASPDLDLYVIGVTPAFSEQVLVSRPSGAAGGGATQLRLDGDTLKGLQTVCAAQMSGGDTAAVERHVGDLWREAHRLRAGISDHHPLTVRALSSLLGRPDLTRGELARLIHGNASEVSRYFHRDLGPDVGRLPNAPAVDPLHSADRRRPAQLSERRDRRRLRQLFAVPPGFSAGFRLPPARLLRDGLERTDEEAFRPPLTIDAGAHRFNAIISG